VVVVVEVSSGGGGDECEFQKVQKVKHVHMHRK